MIKILYVIVITIVLFVGLTFTYMNGQVVEVNYFTFHKEISLTVLLLFTLVTGVVAGYVVSMVSSLKARRKIKRDASRLKIELKSQQLSNL